MSTSPLTKATLLKCLLCNQINPQIVSYNNFSRHVNEKHPERVKENNETHRANSQSSDQNSASSKIYKRNYKQQRGSQYVRLTKEEEATYKANKLLKSERKANAKRTQRSDVDDQSLESISNDNSFQRRSNSALNEEEKHSD